MDIYTVGLIRLASDGSLSKACNIYKWLYIPGCPNFILHSKDWLISYIW
jgi:hypothetical protein